MSGIANRNLIGYQLVLDTSDLSQVLENLHKEQSVLNKRVSSHDHLLEVIRNDISALQRKSQELEVRQQSLEHNLMIFQRIRTDDEIDPELKKQLSPEQLEFAQTLAKEAREVRTLRGEVDRLTDQMTNLHLLQDFTVTDVADSKAAEAAPTKSKSAGGVEIRGTSAISSS
eukprot:NODE_1993_length_678_cov_3.851180_g1943_i0.p1 GENE.NODE_1993_length_678_cov_3.851180_g1943_i0~~NODE_1993_length_678_cov_3.851180_g1943_i0.p1  ORF type:complete len:171 (+),score=35.50 NODE_1993_length_678_cov_3.851180_g1943_i0:155-667(+)